MAIKYVSGKTRELKVGLSSYSEGKPSLQVTGNVGVGTTNPLKKANPANTSVVSSGIVTAYQIFAQIYSGSDAGTGNGTFDRQANIAIGDTFTGNTGIVSNFKYGNISIGNCAGKGIFGGAQKNVLIGENAGSGIRDGSKNVVIGDGALGNTSGISGDDNFAVGDAAGAQLTSGSNNIMLGDNTGSFTSTGGCNIFIGRRTGMANMTGSGNIMLGQLAGYIFSSNGDGDENILIGNCVKSPYTNPHKSLTIGHFNHQWIHGDSNYSIGIGITNPSDASVAIGNTQKLAAGIVTAYTIFSDQLNVTGIATINTLDSLNISGVSTFAGISTFYDDVDFVGTPVGTALTSVQFHKGDGGNSDLDSLRLYDSAQLSVGAGATGGFTMRGNWNGAGPTFNSFILTRGDNFFIDGGTSTAIKIRTQFARNAIVANSDNGGSGTVELYHSVGGTATKRLETSGIGVSVYDALTVAGNTETQTLNVTGVSTFAGISTFVGVSTFNNDVEFIGDAAGITSAFWDKSANELKFYDGSKITLGDGQDLELSHNGTDSLIRDSRASGSVLRIGADKLWLQNKDGNEPYLEATDNGSVKLYHDFAPRFETTGIGISVAGIGSTAYIEGPSNIVIDPHPYGIGATSGNVFIRGDLYVEGTEFIVDVDKIELGDFQIGIATTAGTNALLDGAGIGIGSTNIRKFITWNNATNALMTSENWNLASGKHYEINGTDVLTSDTLLVGTGASVHSPSNNILTLHTNGAEKLRIDASGNLGIGTAAPTDSANIANTSVTSAGIVTAVEYYGVFKGSIPGFSTVFSSGQGQFSASPGTPYTIDTFAFSTHDYQIAEYTLHFVHANGIQAQKALVMQDNSVAYSNEYGVMYDSELLVSIAATVSGGNVNITATPEAGISGVTTFRWRREVQT